MSRWPLRWTRVTRQRSLWPTVGALVVAAAVAAILIVPTLVARTDGHSGALAARAQGNQPKPSAHSSGPATGEHGINPAMAACQLKHSNPAACAGTGRTPLSKPDPSGPWLLSRYFIVSRWGPGPNNPNIKALAVLRTTERRLNEYRLDLSGAPIVNPRRIVWVITVYCSKPYTLERSGASVIAGSAGQKLLHKKYWVESDVLDAAAGQSISECTCAALTPTGNFIRYHPPA